MLRSNPSRRAGFSLIELVITMSIMAILVGVVSMRSGNVTDKARATKIIKAVNDMKNAVALYVGDVAQMPREESGRTGATYYRLSMDPGIEGWSGPYIERPISTSMHPTGRNNVRLRPGAWASRNNGNGFDLDGDGTQDIAPNAYWDTCCTLDFDGGITEQVAQKVDQALDGGVGGDWQDSGVVEFHGSSLSILIYQ